MNKATFVLFGIFTVVTLATSNCYAEYNSPEQLIEAGVNMYKKEGAKGAILGWLKGSALEGSKEALSQANVLRQIEDFYGNFLDYDIIKTNNLSKKSKIYCVAFNFNEGILYGKFQIYKNHNNKLVSTEFKFHTESTMIFPPWIVFGK